MLLAGAVLLANESSRAMLASARLSCTGYTDESNAFVLQPRDFALLHILDLKYMFLVGGFAESPILQREIRQAFGAKLKVLIPQDVALTVLKGCYARRRRRTRCSSHNSAGEQFCVSFSGAVVGDC